MSLPINSVFWTIVLIILIMSIAGCSMPGQKKDNESIARDIVLNDPVIKDEIAKSDGSYSSDARPADLNVTGYLNYSGNFYRVFINTATGVRGPILRAV